MKEAVLFRAVDNFGNHYKFVVVSDSKGYQEIARENTDKSTEIYDWEVVLVRETKDGDLVINI